MTLYLRTQSGYSYEITEEGWIKRLDMDFTPSESWVMLGLQHCHQRRVITLSELRRGYGPSQVWPTSMPDLLYKNGKPQWRVVDRDHGTRRVWSDGPTTICKLN